jgi:hypothetical protein
MELKDLFEKTDIGGHTTFKDIAKEAGINPSTLRVRKSKGWFKDKGIEVHEPEPGMRDNFVSNADAKKIVKLIKKEKADGEFEGGRPEES